ncbi:MAG TPA: EamA family transporter [Pyrinomonadaceae bacterium]|nr:EamA family transporter [Pyrinomonadaceae bacterium]
MKSRLVWLLLCLIWGSTWLFIKLGLKDLPPLTFAGIRFIIASLILLGLLKIRKQSLPTSRRDWMLLAGVGVMSFSLNYGLVFWGEQYISSGLAALLQATAPAFGLVFAHFYLPAERITPAKLVGVLIGVVGVGIIFSSQLSIAGPTALKGSLALLLSAVFVAYSNVIVKAYCKHLEPTVLAAGQMMCGLVPLLLIGIPLEGNPFNFHWTMMTVVAMFYLAIVGSVVAFVLYYWLMKNMDVTKTLLIALVTPVVAVILGMIVLKERLEWRTLLGGALIISGIALLRGRRKLSGHKRSPGLEVTK